MSHEQEVDLSIVIVTYNNENEIAVCLDSLLLETKPCNCQVIMVDNGSTDDTLNIVKSALFEKECLELVANERNLGFTRGLNLGLKRSTGNLLLALNPDTVIQPMSLNTLVANLREGENVGVIAPQLLNADGTVQPSCRRFPRRRDVLFELCGLSYLFRQSKVFNRWKMGDFDHRHRRDVDQPQGACLLFKRQLLSEVGLWDESFPMFFSDVDWCRRVKSKGYDIVFEPAAKVVHLKGVSVRQNRPGMIWSSHYSFYRYFKKHANRFPILNEILGLTLLVTAPLRIIWLFLWNAIKKR